MSKHRGFKDIYEHDEHIIKQWNSVVHKRDLTYILGDITMEDPKWYFRLDELNGRKIVILGNHDRYQDVPELMKYVESVGAMVKYKGVFLTHCPIHTRELEYRVPFSIHGHIHEYNVELPDGTKDVRYICVSMEQIDYKPKTLGELIPNWDDKHYRTKFLTELKEKRENKSN
jgi:calcineurin-like phosphoesterase family protein